MKERGWCWGLVVLSRCFEFSKGDTAMGLPGSGGARRTLVRLLVVMSVFVCIENLLYAGRPSNQTKAGLLIYNI